MGIGAWIALLAASAALATAVQLALVPRERRTTDSDWVFLAGGGLIGGFTGHAWYAVGPTFDGLNVVPAIIGLAIGALVLEIAYRFFLRPRRS